MINPNIIHSQTGEAIPLDTVAKVEDILACPANIASLCMCIVALQEERKLWLEPNKEMVLAGLGEIQRIADKVAESSLYPAELTDEEAAEAAIYVLQAMAGKRNG